MLKLFFILFALTTFPVSAEDHATVSVQRWLDKVVVTIDHDKGWHTYWKNPGDSGLPSAFKFTSDGKPVSPVAFEWPVPEKHLEAGDILTIGYEDRQHFFFDQLASNLEVHVTMLICKDICIPGEAKLKLKRAEQFNSNRPAASYNPADLETAFEKLPQESPAPAELEYYLTREKDQNNLTLHYSLKGISGSPGHKLSLLTPFPRPPFGYKRESLFTDGETLYGKTEIEWDGEYQEPPMPLPNDGSFKSSFELDFLFNPPKGEVSKIKLKIKDFSLASPSLDDFYKKLRPLDAKGSLGKSSAGGNEGSFLEYLFLAFLGGLILNLMPCVLPVISLKLFGLIKHQEYTQKKLFAHNLSYTAGVISTFMALALVIAGLKATGEEVGWGFQLQSPTFILIMMIALFVLSLNLFGLFEFITPGGNKLGSAKTEEGFSGDFFSGVLTTILSTPCSAPFLGTALTFAFTANYATIFVMFFFIGLGLAFPFILTAIFPASLHIFPRPGAWMEKLKYFLGLSLVATVIWLYDVFVSLVDFPKISWRLNLLFVLWFFAFFFIKKISRNRIMGFLVFLAPITLTLMAAQHLELRPKASLDSSTDALWKPWSQEKLNEYKGQTVFMDFTAEWCLTCKVNKKLVLETETFTTMAQEKKLVLLRADWTRRDDNITQFLKSQGAVGVPAYFIQKPNGEIISLGETISTGKVTDLLK